MVRLRGERSFHALFWSSPTAAQIRSPACSGQRINRAPERPLPALGGCREDVGRSDPVLRGGWTAHAARARGLKNLHVGRLDDLDFPDHHFDVVYAAQVLEHLPSPKEDLAEIRRILRPGGLLYADVPNYRTLPILLGKNEFVLNMPPQHINYFTPRTLRALLRSAGFGDVRISSSGGLNWENLLGKRIQSDILAAYETGGSESSSSRSPERSRPGRGAARWVKRAVVASLIRPICYDGMKLGMNLISVARRP